MAVAASLPFHTAALVVDTFTNLRQQIAHLHCRRSVTPSLGSLSLPSQYVPNTLGQQHACTCCSPIPWLFSARSVGKGQVVVLLYSETHVALGCIFKACKANQLQWYLGPPEDQEKQKQKQNTPGYVEIPELSVEKLAGARDVGYGWDGRVRDQRDWASVLGGIVGSLLARCVLQWFCWSADTLIEHALVCAVQRQLVDATVQHMLTCFLSGHPCVPCRDRA